MRDAAPARRVTRPLVPRPWMTRPTISASAAQGALDLYQRVLQQVPTSTGPHGAYRDCVETWQVMTAYAKQLSATPATMTPAHWEGLARAIDNRGHHVSWYTRQNTARVLPEVAAALTAMGGTVWSPAHEIWCSPAGVAPRDKAQLPVLPKADLEQAWRAWWAQEIRAGRLVDALRETAVALDQYRNVTFRTVALRTLPQAQQVRQTIATHAPELFPVFSTFVSGDDWRWDKLSARMRRLFLTAAPTQILAELEPGIAAIGRPTSSQGRREEERGRRQHKTTLGFITEVAKREDSLPVAVRDAMRRRLLAQMEAVSPATMMDHGDLSRIVDTGRRIQLWRELMAWVGPIPDDEWVRLRQVVMSPTSSEAQLQLFLLNPAIPEEVALGYLEANPGAAARNLLARNKGLVRRSAAIRAHLLSAGRSRSVWCTLYQETPDGAEAGRVLEFLVQRGHLHLAQHLLRSAKWTPAQLALSTGLIKRLLLDSANREDRVSVIQHLGSGHVAQREMAPLPPVGRRPRTPKAPGPPPAKLP